MRRWTFAKGHGTENDFVLLVDREGMLDISAADVRAICDRRAGIGADGLLRVIKAKHIPEWDGDPDLWFMDYRNADGSIAEMCGNGVRVFARYLTEEGLAGGPEIPIATRAGVREAIVLPDGRIRVGMGPVEVSDEAVTLRVASHPGADPPTPLAALSADVGNPHAVSFVDDLERLDLHYAPTWQPAEAFPKGVNLEFVRPVAERHIAMRVHERGVGETRSCGTGTVAAAAATAQRDGVIERPITYRVDIPGGTVEVELGTDQSYLTGPAVIVAHGELILPE